MLRALVARAVRAAGHDVIAEAHDTASAIAALATVRPDAVIVDGRLPPSGAVDAIVRMRATGSTAKFFVLAALAERDLVRAAVAAGAAGALLRPLRPGALAEALDGA